MGNHQQIRMERAETSSRVGDKGGKWEQMGEKWEKNGRKKEKIPVCHIPIPPIFQGVKDLSAIPFVKIKTLQPPTETLKISTRTDTHCHNGYCNWLLVPKRHTWA